MASVTRQTWWMAKPMDFRNIKGKKRNIRHKANSINGKLNGFLKCREEEKRTRRGIWHLSQGKLDAGPIGLAPARCLIARQVGSIPQTAS